MDKSPFIEKDSYLIAECAYSHEGDIGYVEKSIEKVAETGCANAIKFHVLCDLETYMVPDHDLYKILPGWLFPRNEWIRLFDKSRSSGLDIIILADDLGCLDFLKSVEDKLTAVEIHASSLNNIKMLEKVAGLNIPVILGIGGSTLDEISFAIDYLKKHDKKDIVLMYGFQNYPTKYENINLKKIGKIFDLFNLPVGYADHTSWDNENNELITIAGFLSGARIIEKHFVLDKGVRRVDYEAAVSSADFVSLKEKIDVLIKALGRGQLELHGSEKEYGITGPMKKAIVSTRDIEAGEEITTDNITYKRTKEISNVKQRDVFELFGRKAKGAIKKNELVTFENTCKGKD